MRLIYIVNQRLPTEKAYGIQIVKMCEAFALGGADVTLLIPQRGNPSGKTVFDYYGIKNNFKIVQLRGLDFYWPGIFDKVAFLIKQTVSALVLVRITLRNKYDIIYSRDELPLFLLSFFRKNLVFEAHKFSSRRYWFYRRFKKAGVKMVVISGGLKNEFVKFGFEADKVLVAHDGVDIKEFNITETQEECLHRFDLPFDKKIIGYVGQLKTMGMEKGIDILIEAIVELRKSHPDILLVIMGGIAEDIEYYKNIAKQRGIDDMVIFLGRKDHFEIPYFLKACNVLTMPFPNIPHYANYMSPLKMFEYMASGQPIVATNLPTVTEVLNENNSVLVKSDNSRDLVVGINRILNDSNLAEKISRQALADVKNYSWAKRVLRILN